MQKLSKEVVDLFRKVLKTDAIDENSEVGRPSQWDSLSHVKLILALEEKFALKVGADHIASLTSIKAIADFLERWSKK